MTSSSSTGAVPDTSASARQAGTGNMGAGDLGCTFDWVDLGEAFRACPVYDGISSAWTPHVRTMPKELVVPSGGELRFTVALGSDGRGPWTADLDDRCGIALRPLLLDAREQPVGHDSLRLPAACPTGRARVTLSSRGAITSQLVWKAVRQEPERVIVGQRTLPNGVVEDVSEWREREVPLTPGDYFIELQLPTGDAQIVKLPLRVSKSP